MALERDWCWRSIRWGLDWELIDFAAQAIEILAQRNPRGEPLRLLSVGDADVRHLELGIVRVRLDVIAATRRRDRYPDGD